MPKMKLPDEEMKNRLFTGLARKQMEVLGLKATDVAVKAHIERSTFYNYMNNPSKMPFGKFRKITEILHFTDEEILSVK